MDKKEAFKEFVRKHPSLTRYIKNNNKTWQNLYEIYDIEMMIRLGNLILKKLKVLIIPKVPVTLTLKTS